MRLSTSHYTNATVTPASSGARPAEIPPWLWFRLAQRRRMVQNPTIHAEGLHLPEAECLRCGCLVPDGRRLCPAYGTALATLDDVVERASERTLDDRGRVW